MVIGESSDAIGRFVFNAVMICWCLFAAAFLLRKRPAKSRETRRDWTAMVGLSIQFIGYAIVWFRPLRRKSFSPPCRCRTQ